MLTTSHIPQDPGWPVQTWMGHDVSQSDVIMRTHCATSLYKVSIALVYLFHLIIIWRLLNADNIPLTPGPKLARSELDRSWHPEVTSS